MFGKHTVIYVAQLAESSVFNRPRIFHAPRGVQYFHAHKVAVLVKVEDYSGLFLVAFFNNRRTEDKSKNINLWIVGYFHVSLQYFCTAWPENSHGPGLV